MSERLDLFVCYVSDLHVRFSIRLLSLKLAHFAVFDLYELCIFQT